MINKKPLIKFLIWVSILFVLVFVGINNIFALETKTIYSVNNNGTLASANTYNYGYLTGGGTQATARANVNTTISGKSYGFMFLFYEPVVLNKTYTMVINFMDIDLLKSFNSSMVRVATCNGDTCNDNTIVSVVKSNNNGNSNKLTIQFNPITTGSVVLVNLSGNNEAITGVSTFGIKSVTLESSNPNQDIIDNNTQNSNNIINNQNSNTQDIIDSQESNASVIIENQNSNASAIQDTINSNFQNCRNSINLFTGLVKGIAITAASGVQTTNSQRATSDYIPVNFNQNPSYYLSGLSDNLWSFVAAYNSNKQFLGRTNAGAITSTLLQNNYFTNGTPQGTGDIAYLRIMQYEVSNLSGNINDVDNLKIQLEIGNHATEYEPYGEQICTNKLDEQTNSINDLNDSINNDNVDDNGIASSFESFNDYLDDNSTITQLITLPITLYTAILNNLNGTCQPFNLGKLYGEDLILPCINISQYLGNSLWTMIDIIISGFAVYAISKKMIKVFNNFSSLREGDVIDD